MLLPLIKSSTPRSNEKEALTCHIHPCTKQSITQHYIWRTRDFCDDAVCGIFTDTAVGDALLQVAQMEITPLWPAPEQMVLRESTRITLWFYTKSPASHRNRGGNVSSESLQVLGRRHPGSVITLVPVCLQVSVFRAVRTGARPLALIIVLSSSWLNTVLSLEFS